MTEALRRRGPDGAGVWIEPGDGHAAKVGFAHTRLSIQDVSELGAQPMTSPSGRWVITFNGEIYNFRDLRKELLSSGVRFSGNSDTEVFTAALDRWGFEDTLARVDGMFAVAAFCMDQRRLFLARDRTGEKPLYYGRVGESIVFASTLNALTTLPFWVGGVSEVAVALLMRYRYVPAPHTIFKNLKKLPVASFAVIDVEGHRDEPKVGRYWSLPAGEAGSDLRDTEILVRDLDAILGSVVSEQLVSDRPLGAFLSGGVDSTLVTALMCEQSRHRVKTFTVAFEEPEFNEGPFARAIADHLGTEHTEVVLPAYSCIDFVPRLPEIYDEPFADASQLPMLMVAQAAREEVVVALSGDGGDESFAGYDRYARSLGHWRRLQAKPSWQRSAIASASGFLSRRPFEPMATLAFRALSVLGRGRRAGSVLRRWRQEHLAEGVLELYHNALVMSREEALTESSRHERLDSSGCDVLSSDLRKMMCFDYAHYLPDDVLVKVDRATMHHGLESRAPLLDRRILEFAWGLPDNQLATADGAGKVLLRQLLDRKVPPCLTDRPKRGFAVPMARWLRSELRDWAEPLLSQSALDESGLLDTNGIRKRWDQHVAGVWDNSSLIWTVLQFQAWFARLRA